MAEFVWILSADRQESLGAGGIHPTYIIPQGEINSLANSLGGNLLWIVLRANQDRFVAVITIKKIERFSESYNSGDYLIHADMVKSFRLAESYDKAKNYVFKPLSHLNVGISKLDKKEREDIKHLISKKITIKLAPPKAALLSKYAFKPIGNDYKIIIKEAISLIVRNFSLENIWGSGSGVKLNPFSNFAFELLKFQGNWEYDYEIQSLEYLKAINPLGILTESRAFPLQNPKSGRPRVIDLSFTEINPNDIYARNFVAGSSLYDLEAAMAKTDSAEKLHQSILRDLVIYLKSLGIPCFESSSVDLMFIVAERKVICEIKSANSDNLISQAAKGAFQITSYLNAMIPEFSKINGFLIINKIDDEFIMKFVGDTLKSMGISFRIYDPTVEWPKRVQNLLN